MRPAGPGRGDLRGRPDRVRPGPGDHRGGDALRGGGAVEAERPAGDRVKTDARDAVLLARLLRIGRDHRGAGARRITEEAARDLVRAREDVRGDLMRARHRVSKLLLRHGHVYGGGTGLDRRARRLAAPIRFDQPGTQAAFEADLRSGRAHPGPP